TGVLVLVEHLLEGRPAIGRTKDAALRIGAVRMSCNRDEQPVGIVRINRHLRNLLPLAQSQVRPGGAAIGGFVDSISDRQIGTMQAFAAGNVNDVGVGGRDFDGADGASWLVVKNWLPG